MKQANRHGFSMVEMLVASTILIMIVMMMAMLFQQTSDAWRTGLMRANGYMQLRSSIGAIQRDASTAIDAKNLPARILSRNGKQTFEDASIKFYALTGKDDERALKFIQYDLSGTACRRIVRTLRLTGDGTWDEASSSELLNVLSSKSGSKDDATVRVSDFDFEWANGTEYDSQGLSVNNVNRLPLYIRVDAEVVQRGSLYYVGAASAGPDGVWDTKDDLQTW